MPDGDYTPDFKATLRANKKRLAFFWHPDRSKTTGIPVPICNKVSALVNTWYDVLNDMLKRTMWEAGQLQVMEVDGTGILKGWDRSGPWQRKRLPGIGVFAELGGTLDTWVKKVMEALQICKGWVMPEQAQASYSGEQFWDEEFWSLEREE